MGFEDWLIHSSWATVNGKFPAKGALGARDTEINTKVCRGWQEERGCAMARAAQSQCPSNRHHVDSSPFVLSFVFLCTVLSQCTGSVICPNIGHCGCLVVMDAKGARDRTGITHRELHCQEKQECYCYFSMMKVFLLLSPQFPQWSRANVAPHLEVVCMEQGLIWVWCSHRSTGTLNWDTLGFNPSYSEKLLFEITFNFA